MADLNFYHKPSRMMQAAVLASGLYFCSLGFAKVAATEENQRLDVLEAKMTTIENLLQQHQQADKREKEVHQLVLDSVGYGRGAPVTTSPYIGTFSEYDHQNLFATLADIGEDYSILNERSKLRARLVRLGEPSPRHPSVDLSGYIDGRIFYERPYTGHDKSDIDLDDSEVDLVAELNDWATAYIGINYDSGLASSGQRIANSRLFLNKGFMVLGNIDQAPIYVSFGQMFVPFGHYATPLITDPFTKKLGKTSARALSIGYHEAGDFGTYGNLYAFQGDSRSGHHGTVMRNDKINNWGANLGHIHHFAETRVELRGGYIDNLADSKGMQSNTGFGGFGGLSVTEVLEHHVGGMDIALDVDHGPLGMLLEYTGAVRHFDPLDMTYGNDGARPAAAQIEATYNFNLTSAVPAGVVVSYGQTFEALALGFPQRRYSIALNANVMRDVLAAIELRHDRHYDDDRTASGAGLAVDGSNLGHSATRVTTLFQYKF